MLTPWLAQAPCISPEQSQAPGPVPPHRYGSPIWAIANWTAPLPWVLPVRVSPFGPGAGLAGPAVDPSAPAPGHGLATTVPAVAPDGAAAPLLLFHSCAVSWVASGSHWAYSPR